MVNATVEPQLSELVGGKGVWIIKSTNFHTFQYTELCSTTLIKHTLVDKTL